MKSRFTTTLMSVLFLAVSSIVYGDDDFETDCEGGQEVPAVFTDV